MHTLPQISTFVKVVDCNGFAAAARQLGVSTAAVSKQVAALEKGLGVQLLQRSTRTVTLSYDGRMFYELSKEILEKTSELEALVSTLHKEPSGLLRIYAGCHLGRKFILPHLKEFMTLFPQVTVSLHFTQTFPDLSQGDVDLVFGLSSSGPIDSIQKQIGLTRDILVASPDYLEEHGKPASPDDLVNHKVITHTGRKPGDILTFKDGKQVHVNPVLWLNDTSAMLDCALQGQGIIRLHQYIVEKALKRGELVEVLPQAMPKKKTIPLYLCYPESRYLHSKVRHFIDFVLEKMKNMEL